MVGFRDRLMFGPDPGMVGDQVATTPDPDPDQVRGHLDAPPNRDRVHRVVVAIQTHVVIARQPGRGPPPNARSDRRQRQHRRLVGLDPIRRAAPQHAVLAVIGPHHPVAQLGVEIRWRAEHPTRHFGGPSEANAAFTVFREIPNTRAISEIGQLLRPTQPPDLCPVLHVQHSLPRWPIAKVLQEAGQFSVAVDT